VFIILNYNIYDARAFPRSPVTRSTSPLHIITHMNYIYHIIITIARIDTIIIMGLDVSPNGVPPPIFTSVVPTAAVTGNRKSMRPLFSISHRRGPGCITIYSFRSCFPWDPTWWREVPELFENHADEM